MEEIWKDIENYEGLYQVSNFGRIKSLNYHRTGKERVLKEAINTYGYLQVFLFKEGKQKNLLIHRLVAQAFLPNPDNLPEVNHKDENPSNNHVENLEWCDRQYNVSYGTGRERAAKTNTNGKTSKPVAQYDLEENLIKVFPSTMEVERQTGFFQSYISACCNGKHKTAYGFKWQYAVSN